MRAVDRTPLIGRSQSIIRYCFFWRESTISLILLFIVPSRNKKANYFLGLVILITSLSISRDSLIELLRIDTTTLLFTILDNITVVFFKSIQVT